MKDLDKRAKTTKNIGEKFHAIEFGNDYWATTTKAHITKEKSRSIRFHQN